MSNLLDKVFGRIFPKPEDGNPCHEAAFDPELMPKAVREKLEQAQAKEENAKLESKNKP
ncbi:MAG: hypothetical protein AB9917_18835 [Negativicutes bacterium]